MVLYLGDKKVMINMNGTTYSPYLLVSPPPSAISLISSDGYILKDSDGLILVVKERE